MAYIGQNLDRFSIVEKLDVITPATATGAGPYNLTKGSVAFVPASADTMVVSINGVAQYGNFTVNGSTITFSGALVDADTCDFIYQMGTGLISTPADGTVNIAKLSATGTKDATTFLRGDNTFATVSGDISSVVAGTNLSGGGISGDVTINLADASTSAKGAASFSSDNFAASSGVITIKDLGVTTAELSDNAVTADKLANSISTAITANTAKVTNATHSGEVTGATALTIADNIVDEANLKVSNAPSNGYMLTAQSGNTGGLTWAEASSGAMTLISTTTLTQTVANVTVSGMDSTYKNYKVIVSGLVPQDDNYTLFARTIVSGSIVTDNYYLTEFTQHENATGDNGKSINTNSWKIIGSGANYLGKNSGENTNIEMTFFDPSNTSLRTMVSCVTTYQTDEHTPGFTDSSMFYDTTSALQGVNFIMSNGNITAGTFKLYGIS